MRVNTTLSRLRGGCGLFRCGWLICMRCAMVTCFIWALLFFCILFLGPLAVVVRSPLRLSSSLARSVVRSCLHLPSSSSWRASPRMPHFRPSYRYQIPPQVPSVCSSLLHACLSSSWSSSCRYHSCSHLLVGVGLLLFELLELWIHGRPCATATERNMGRECATCRCTMQQPTCTRCTQLAQDLHTLRVRRTTHMHMSKHIAVQSVTR